MKYPPKLIISGAPASGKGTQCEFIKHHYHGIVHLSTGDILRSAIQHGTPDGLQAKDYMDRGALVPDELIIQIILARLQESDVLEFGCLLDGFPRTMNQGQALLSSGFQCDAFIQLNVDDNLLVERVIGRRMDPVTGKIYHLKYSPPPQEEEILARLVHRSDDTEEKVTHRIAAYHHNLNPILSLFHEKMITINGNRAPPQIWNDLRIQLHRQLSNEVIFVLGGPGSGKGTLCEKLSEQSGYCHLSAGDLLREELKSGSESAEMIKTISSQGGLVPAELVIGLISKAMDTIRQSSNGRRKKFLIDGFPRNQENLITWYKLMSDHCIVDFVLNLECTEEVMKERILNRSKTSGRVDDNEVTLLKRFHTFHADTQPVLASYDRLGKLRTVDATLTPNYILHESLQIVQSIRRLPPLTRTFGLIKPDAVSNGRVADIVDQIQQSGKLIITAAKVLHLNDMVISKFYAEHKGKDFYGNLSSFMSSGPCIAMILEGVDAINTWRALMGPTNTQKAQEISPKSLRALYGTDGTRNAVHGSDSEYAALREIDFIFSPTGEGISSVLPRDKYPKSLDLRSLENFMHREDMTHSSHEYSFGGLPLQETYAMIKPITAQTSGDEIISILKGHGFTILGQIMIPLTSELAEGFYAEHRGKPFYSNLIKYMTSRPIIGLKLLRHGAISGWRLLMGPTDRTTAVNERGNDSIRALYGMDGTRNAVHGSDSLQSANRELQYFFTFGPLSASSSNSFGSPTRPGLPPLHHTPIRPPGNGNSSPTKKSAHLPPMSRVDVNLMQNYNLHEVNPVMGPLLSKMMISRPKDVTEFAIHELQKLQEKKKKDQENDEEY